MKRRTALALLTCIPLFACKQPSAVASTPVSGSSNVVVRSAKVYDAHVGATEIGQGYYIVCQLTFTNDLGHDVAPEPKNFVLYDAYGQPYPGVDSGSSVLIGVSNFTGIVKKDAKQDYTVAFRVPSVTSGSVFYASN